MTTGKSRKLALLVAAAGLAAGCGGAQPTPSQKPVLQRSVARDLATKSDAIAATLDRGDRCAAAVQAAGLRRAAHAAVESGRVAVAFRRRLLAAVDSLAASLPSCPPPPEQGNESGDEGHDHGKHKGQGKHGKKGGG